MVSNTEFAIICSIGCVGLGGLNYIAWKHMIENIVKYRKYNKRLAHIQDPDNFITPDSIETEFEGMTIKEKKVGKELMVTGYALSLKTWILMSQDKVIISPKLTKYLEGLPRELAVVDRVYPNLDFEYNAWGNKFAIQHRGKQTIFIEPFKKTHLLGFEEFYHKKGMSFSDLISGLGTVSSANVGKDLSSWILFEGDYITAFGIVKYQMSDDSLSMTRPIAIVKGGLESLLDLFVNKKSEKLEKVYGYMILATACTIASVGWFVGARYFYNKVKERSIQRDQERSEIEDLNCANCKEEKRNMLFKPWNHLLYCQKWFESPAFNPKFKEECQICKKNIESSSKVYIP